MYFHKYLLRFSALSKRTIGHFCFYVWIVAYKAFSHLTAATRTWLGQIARMAGIYICMLGLFKHFSVNWNLWQTLLIFHFQSPSHLDVFPTLWLLAMPRAHTSTCLGQICVADLFVYGQQIARSLLMLL